MCTAPVTQAQNNSLYSSDSSSETSLYINKNTQEYCNREFKPKGGSPLFVIVSSVLPRSFLANSRLSPSHICSAPALTVQSRHLDVFTRLQPPPLRNMKRERFLEYRTFVCMYICASLAWKAGRNVLIFGIENFILQGWAPCKYEPCRYIGKGPKQKKKAYQKWRPQFRRNFTKL
jgi:hypothetical protein